MDGDGAFEVIGRGWGEEQLKSGRPGKEEDVGEGDEGREKREGVWRRVEGRGGTA